MAAAALLFGPTHLVRAQYTTFRIPASRVEAIRFWSFGDTTRIAIQTQGAYRINYDQLSNPPRAFFDLSGIRPPATARNGFETLAVHDQRVKQIRISAVSATVTRIVFDLEGPADIVSSQLVNPDRLMIEIRPKTNLPLILATRSVTGSRRLDEVASADPLSSSAASVTPPAVRVPASQRVVSDAPRLSVPAHLSPVASGTPPFGTNNPTLQPSSAPKTLEAKAEVPRADLPKPEVSRVDLTHPATPPVQPLPTEHVQTPSSSLVRVFGLKMAKIVIDAGHGGHDTGTIGPDGLLEKDLVLDVALRLGALVQQRLGSQVVYTRSDDTFIPLETRTKIAEDQRADLFISIHANSSPERKATGVETYYFNLTSDKAGLDLATRENATSTNSISDLNDLLHRAVLQTKQQESRDFAAAVQNSLWAMSVKMNSASRDRGVRQAPFAVLIGATMPSILAEVGFVSNPHDEKLMRRSEQRQKIADALYRGIAAYAQSLTRDQLARASASR